MNAEENNTVVAANNQYQDLIKKFTDKFIVGDIYFVDLKMLESSSIALPVPFAPFFYSKEFIIYLGLEEKSKYLFSFYSLNSKRIYKNVECKHLIEIFPINVLQRK